MSLILPVTSSLSSSIHLELTLTPCGLQVRPFEGRVEVNHVPKLEKLLNLFGFLLISIWIDLNNYSFHSIRSQPKEDRPPRLAGERRRIVITEMLESNFNGFALQRIAESIWKLDDILVKSFLLPITIMLDMLHQ